jgi:hypothetical protein
LIWINASATLCGQRDPRPPFRLLFAGQAEVSSLGYATERKHRRATGDDKFKLGGLHDRKVGGLLAAQNARHEAVDLSQTIAVCHQAAGVSKFVRVIYRRYPMTRALARSGHVRSVLRRQNVDEANPCIAGCCGISRRGSRSTWCDRCARSGLVNKTPLSAGLWGATVEDLAQFRRQLVRLVGRLIDAIRV